MVPDVVPPANRAVSRDKARATAEPGRTEPRGNAAIRRVTARGSRRAECGTPGSPAAPRTVLYRTKLPIVNLVSGMVFG